MLSQFVQKHLKFWIPVYFLLIAFDVGVIYSVIILIETNPAPYIVNIYIFFIQNTVNSGQSGHLPIWNFATSGRIILSLSVEFNVFYSG